MTPDIEIYIKKVEAGDVLRWLETIFEVGEQIPSGDAVQVKLTYQGDSLKCTVIERAVKGGYTSVWFKSNHTPWADDEACARDAFSYFDQEVRCSTGPWTGDSESSGGWYRFTEQGRSIVNWLA